MSKFLLLFMGLQEVILDYDRDFSINSEIISVSAGKNYEISTEVVGINGDPFCGFFGIIILDKNNKEIDRKVRWLNDFSRAKKKFTIIFKASTNQIIAIYRINTETALKSDCRYELLPIENVTIKETEQSKEGNYDELQNIVLERPKELSSEQELILEKNMVWVFGSPRSGTSWLALELLSHKTCFIDHPHIIEHLGTPHIGIMDLAIQRWIDNCKNNPGYFFSDRFKKTWNYYLRKLILNRIFAQINSINQKVILKEPGVAGGADIISECLPNSKIIVILRDGRDVIDSIIDARQEDGFMTKIGNVPPIVEHNRLKFVENRARLWVTFIENVMKTYETHLKNLRLLIRYEDLLENTCENLKRIYKFLEIDISNTDLEKLVTKYSFENIPAKKKGSGKFARSASPGNWKKNFNDEEKKLMENIMGETLKKIRY